MNTMSLPSLVDVPTGAQMPIRRILAAYVNEVRYESLRMLRSPGFSIPSCCCRFRSTCSSA